MVIMTSYGAAPDDLDMAFDWIMAKKINISDLITHRFPLSKIQEAFQVVCEAGDSLKVIIEPEEK